MAEMQLQSRMQRMLPAESKYPSKVMCTQKKMRTQVLSGGVPGIVMPRYRV